MLSLKCFLYRRPIQKDRKVGLNWKCADRDFAPGSHADDSINVNQWCQIRSKLTYTSRIRIIFHRKSTNKFCHERAETCLILLKLYNYVTPSSKHLAKEPVLRSLPGPADPTLEITRLKETFSKSKFDAFYCERLYHAENPFLQTKIERVKREDMKSCVTMQNPNSELVGRKGNISRVGSCVQARPLVKIEIDKVTKEGWSLQVKAGSRVRSWRLQEMARLKEIRCILLRTTPLCSKGAAKIEYCRRFQIKMKILEKIWKMNYTELSWDNQHGARKKHRSEEYRSDNRAAPRRELR